MIDRLWEVANTTPKLPIYGEYSHSLFPSRSNSRNFKSEANLFSLVDPQDPYEQDEDLKDFRPHIADEHSPREFA
jgi:hypothetical protein